MSALEILRTKEGAITYSSDNHEWEILSREILEDIKKMNPREILQFENMMVNIFGEKLTIEQIKNELTERLKKQER